MIQAHLPKRFESAIRSHIERGIPTGGFLTAVLSNDLLKAVLLAGDEQTLAELPGLIAWLYLNAPPGSYGGELSVSRWRKKRGENGAREQAKHVREVMALRVVAT